MDRMETAIASLAGTDAGKARSDMSAACNTFGLDTKAFIELMSAQKPKIRKVWNDICWYWIKRLSHAYTDKVLHDRRNEQSCYTGYYIEKAFLEKYEPLPDLQRDSFISIFIGEMGYDHKTIQQSFSSLVFAWLNYQAAEKKARKAKHCIKNIKTIRGEHWYRMPMI